MSEIDLNSCCGETEPTNPKRDLFHRKTKRADHLFRLTNPIPDEIKDVGEIKKLFKNWNFVPYAGTNSHSGHSLLVWYLMLAKLSPTNAASIKKKIKFAVGGKARVIRSIDPEFETGDELIPVTNTEANEYVSALKMFFEFEGGVSRFHNRVAWQYEATGNSFVEMSFTTVMGQTRISLRAHRTTHCLFLQTKPGEGRAIAISPVWTDKYLEKHPPRVVPFFPVFTKDENGVLRTVFQLKHGDNSWYGRPPSEGADVYKYREVQDAIYLVRAAATNFTGQLILEVEDDDPTHAPAIDDAAAEKVGDDNFVERFEKNFTNKGDEPQSVVIASRPYGSRPMFVFQISPNTKENWYKVTGGISENMILRAHEITPRFLGFDVSNGFSSDVYISDYLLNVQPVIDDLRSEIMNFVNGILSHGWKLVNAEQWNEFSLTFAPPIQSTIEDFKVSGTSAQSKQPDAPQLPANSPNGDPNTEPTNDPNADPNAETPPNKK